MKRSLLFPGEGNAFIADGLDRAVNQEISGGRFSPCWAHKGANVAVAKRTRINDEILLIGPNSLHVEAEYTKHGNPVSNKYPGAKADRRVSLSLLRNSL